MKPFKCHYYAKKSDNEPREGVALDISRDSYGVYVVVADKESGALWIINHDSVTFLGFVK